MNTQNSEELFTEGDGGEEVLVDETLEIPPNKVAIGFHPLGGLGITISGFDGEKLTARLSPPEVYQLVGNLTSLVNILMMEGYMQQMAAQQEAEAQMSRSGIVIPGRG